MDKNISKKLLSYQRDHTADIITNLQNNHICFDTSDPGCGKTYVAIAAASQLDMKLFVVCPKTIISTSRGLSEIENYQNKKLKSQIEAIKYSIS